MFFRTKLNGNMLLMKLYNSFKNITNLLFDYGYIILSVKTSVSAPLMFVF
jgi:hypothetical protein